MLEVEARLGSDDDFVDLTVGRDDDAAPGPTVPPPIQRPTPKSPKPPPWPDGPFPDLRPEALGAYNFWASSLLAFPAPGKTMEWQQRSVAVLSLALFNSIVLRERRLHFGTLNAPPELGTAVNRLVRAASLEYLGLRRRGRKKAGYGSAGTRTEAQKSAARDFARESLARAPPTSLTAFTDGSANPNPGPCGAGAHILDKLDPSWQGAESVAALGPGSNNIGELWAIGMALELAEARLRLRPGAHTHLIIYTDSQYAVGVLDKGWVPKTNKDLAHAVRRKLKALRAVLQVDLSWIPAHVGVQENEHADLLAGRGSEESAAGRCNVELPLKPGLGFLPGAMRTIPPSVLDPVLPLFPHSPNPSF